MGWDDFVRTLRGATRTAISRHRRAQARPLLSEPAEDTLPQWLHQRFCHSPWENLDEADQSHWRHEAAAVRRAVARGGFRQPADPEVPAT